MTSKGTQEIYGQPLALLTDLYQLTMACGYWKLGRGDQQAAFHLVFREMPFGGGYAVAAGLAYLVEYIEGLAFEDEDLKYLARLTGNDDRPLLDPAFLDYLAELEWTVDVDAVPEGTAVFAHEPLVRVTGPLLQCQLLETPTLNLVNFQTLVATKSARVCQAAGEAKVLEFGLRRAQGIDGGLSASRAAYVGSCDGVSNVLAARLFGIPARGTHAHSWVMSFRTEQEAFDRYAEALPNNALFLVDTYDTLEGVRRAVQTGRRLRQRGHEMAGIRLDSGDLAYLSIEARKILDEAGFPEAKIVASSDLDEYLIRDLGQQGARIDIYGVGTRLATAYDQPALGGVYKLAATRWSGQGQWQYQVKLSEQTAKTSTPGVLDVRRFSRDGQFLADAIYDQQLGCPDRPQVVHPSDPNRRRRLEADAASEDLLVPVFRQGRRVYDPPPVSRSRQRTIDQLRCLHPGVRRLANPHEYPAGLERRLHELKSRMILEARGQADDPENQE